MHNGTHIVVNILSSVVISCIYRAYGFGEFNILIITTVTVTDDSRSIIFRGASIYTVVFIMFVYGCHCCLPQDHASWNVALYTKIISFQEGFFEIKYRTQNNNNNKKKKFEKSSTLLRVGASLGHAARWLFVYFVLRSTKTFAGNVED